MGLPEGVGPPAPTLPLSPRASPKYAAAESRSRPPAHARREGGKKRRRPIGSPCTAARRDEDDAAFAAR